MRSLGTDTSPPAGRPALPQPALATAGLPPPAPPPTAPLCPPLPALPPAGEPALPLLPALAPPAPPPALAGRPAEPALGTVPPAPALVLVPPVPRLPAAPAVDVLEGLELEPQPIEANSAHTITQRRGITEAMSVIVWQRNHSGKARALTRCAIARVKLICGTGNGEFSSARRTVARGLRPIRTRALHLATSGSAGKLRVRRSCFAWAVGVRCITDAGSDSRQCRERQCSWLHSLRWHADLGADGATDKR